MNKTISRRRTLKILQTHGNKTFNDLKDFLTVFGNKERYPTNKVFVWLGY
jgi:hypothetical protein